MKNEKEQPMTDDQLSGFLKKWSVKAPDSLEERVFGDRPRAQWWQFLLKGYVRVPVPIMGLVALLMVFAVWKSVNTVGSCTADNIRPAVLAPVNAALAAGVCPANSKC